MKNKTLTAILLMSLPLFLTACTLKDVPIIGNLLCGKGSPQNPVSLGMWGLWESPETMESLISKYQEQSPLVTIKYEDRSVIKPAQYKETVLSRLSEGIAPDIVLIHNSWVNEMKDYLAPMPATLETAKNYSQNFYPVISQSALIDGKIYAAPAHYDGLVLVYNKDHFDEIDQVTPPTAWEEFRRVALALKLRDEKDNLIRSGAAIGTADNIDFFSDILGLMFAQASIEVPGDLDSKAAQDAVSFYVMFSTIDGVWNSTSIEASKAFSQGKVSMIFVPSWNLLDIIKASPDINIGVAPVPQAVPSNPVSWGSFWMYAVPKSSQNAEASWKFIDFLVSDEQQLALFNDSSKIRAYGAPLSSVNLKSQVDSGPLAKYIKPVLDTAPYARSGYFAGRSGNVTQVEALRTAVNSVLSKDATVEEALKTCKDTLVGTIQNTK